MAETMSLFQSDAGKPHSAEERREFGRRLFARCGPAAILLATVLVVVGWISALGWAVMWLLGW
jgi:hypothetical protein